MRNFAAVDEVVRSHLNGGDLDLVVPLVASVGVVLLDDVEAWLYCAIAIAVGLVLNADVEQIADVARVIAPVELVLRLTLPELDSSDLIT